MTPKYFDYYSALAFRLDLDPRDLFVLEWIWHNSQKRVFTSIFHRGKLEYLIRYSDVRDKFPKLFKTERQVALCFDHLCGVFRGRKKDPFTNSYLYPMSRRTVRFGRGRGSANYFRLSTALTKRLLAVGGEIMQDRVAFFLDEKTVPVAVDIKNKRDTALRMDVKSALNTLKALHVRGETEPLFRYREPADEWHYTKAIEKVQGYMQDLYNGKFLQKNKPSEQFLEKNATLIDKEAYAVLEKMKGSWPTVIDTVFQAAHRYSMWFRPECEPQQKGWLTRDLDKWFYEGHVENPRSLFLACLAHRPAALAEVITDRVFDSLPHSAQDKGLEFLRSDWDENKYWYRLGTVVDWYEKNARGIRANDQNAEYWLQQLPKFLDDYLTWLTVFGETLGVSNIGADCPSWQAYLRHVSKHYRLNRYTLDVFRSQAISKSA